MTGQEEMKRMRKMFDRIDQPVNRQETADVSCVDASTQAQDEGRGDVVSSRIHRYKAASLVPRTGKTVDGVDAHLVSLVAPDSIEAEQYRGLRYVVEQMHKAGEGTLIGVCSPSPGDGKSVTAINLAGSLAQ